MITQGASFRSESTTGGYATPDEELPEKERSVRFANTVEGHSVATHNTNGEDAVDRKRYTFLRRPTLGDCVSARCFKKYPRTYACTCGVVFPLVLLVLLSLFFGKFLGDLESEAELKANDRAMRRRAVSETYNSAISDALNSIPTVCYLLYENATLVDDLDDSFEMILEESISLNAWIEMHQPNLTGASIIDAAHFADFMNDCGNSAHIYTNNIQAVWYENITVNPDGDQSLSFKWNRCLNRTERNFNLIFSPSDQDVADAHPDEQERVYAATWRRNQRRIQAQYLAFYEAEDDVTVDDSRLRAFNASIYEASGNETCTVNVASAAWFWFTVMTTVGYGNQSPASVGGRVMVFTLGFLCIVLFGSVLAATGTIVSYLVFDVVHRLKIKLLLRKDVMMLVWGLLWAIWMLFLSATFKKWKEVRLDIQISWEDAYWFSYISTTTVGLGDLYPFPEVLFISDLLGFSLIFLVGFALLASFLSELAQLLAQNLPHLGEELARRLELVGVADIAVLGLEGEREPMQLESESGHETLAATEKTLPVTNPGADQDNK